MTTDRCPACGAAVTRGAPWCTLCYTDLRPPEPQPVGPQPVEPRAATVAAAGPVTAPEQRAGSVAVVAAPLPPDPILDAPIIAAAPVARREVASWPCARCGAQVPMADDVCTSCGAAFLPAESTPSLNLPGVGNVARLDKGQRVMLVVGLAVAVMVVLLGIGFVAGSIV